MTRDDIEKRIKSIDWSIYSTVDDYDSSTVSGALLELINLSESKNAEFVGNKVFSAIANNHRGTYYPAILAAAPIIIDIEKAGLSSASKTCARALLNDLYYFEPEIGSYSD